MPAPLLAALLLILCWGGLTVLVGVDVRLRRADGSYQASLPGSPAPRWAWGALLALALVSGGLRAAAISGRTLRNVDESQYAAQVAFSRQAGESVFATPTGMRGHVLLYELGSLSDPYGAVDAITGLVYGLTALLLGATVLRASGRPWAALLTALCYGVGTLRYEGLTSNAEPYANLFLAAWVFVRLGRPEAERVTPLWQDLLGGVCLGAAAVMKEQTLPCVLVEPILGGVLCAQSTEADRLRLLGRSLLLAALGFWLAVGLWLSGFALAGALGSYLGVTLGWASSLGDPTGREVSGGGGSLLIELGAGLLALWASPTGLLGLAAGLRLLLEASQAGLPGRRLELGLTALLALTLLCVSLGTRWFEHYYLLAFPALAPLAGLRLADAARELKGGRTARRVTSGVLVLSALLLLPVDLSFAAVQAPGGSIDWDQLQELQQLAAAVQRTCPPDRPLFVWGWREELYLLAQRAPACRLRAGWPLRLPLEQTLADLRRFPPGAVVVVEGGGVATAAPDAWDLSRHPALEAWLHQGYQRVDAPRPDHHYQLWLPRRGG